MADALAVVIWWLLLQAMGFVALPLVFRLLRWLPDRGYSVAKPAGLLLGSYTLWLLGTLGWLQNTTGGIVLAFTLVALLGGWVYRRWDDGRKLVDWLRAHWKWIIAYEALFLLAFAAWAAYRAHNPDLSTTEKPMEFAFMNAIRRSPTFPPPDPWLSGFAISYYYFGYVMMATLTKLSGVASGVAFSLSNALWFALTAAGAFGIAANLVAAAKRASSRAIVVTGLLGALFVAVVSNFEAPLDVAHTNGIGSAELWRWLDIQEINTPPQPFAAGEVRWPFCSGCGHPRGSWWFWRASRVVHDYPPGSDRSDPAEYQELIDEFPLFSFLLGDMHPHVLALPYALMSLALAYNVFRMSNDTTGQQHDLAGLQTSEVSHEPATRDEAASPARAARWLGSEWKRWFWDAAPIAVAYPIFLGALGFLNTWDFPIHVFIVVLAWGLGRWIQSRRLETPPTSIWIDAVVALIACGLLGVVAYLPFYIGFRSQAAGIVPNLYNPTRLPQFFVMFGPWLLIGAAFTLALLNRAVRQRQLTTGRTLIGSLGGAFGIVAGAALVTAAGTLVFLLVSESARAKLDEGLAIIAAQGLSVGQMLMARLGNLWTPLLLGAALAGIIVLLRATARGDRRPEADGAGDAGAFTLMLFGVGALLTFAVEFVYLLDQFGTRMNTVFKVYYQAWAVWGVASAYGVYHLWQSSERLTSAVGRVGFAGLAAISIVSGLVYPALAIQSGTVGRPIAPTLDASAPTRDVYAPDEAAAIDWLERNADGTAVILEAEGQSYRDNTSRVSAWSGVPSVLGWVGHEGQWRGNYDDIAPRQPDIDRIYNTTDSTLALALMKKYNVVYVYVGPNEAAKYPPQGLAKFNAIMEVAFQRGNSTLYRLPEVSRADTLSTR